MLAASHVQALQAGGVGASLKHFAANDQETDRMVVSADMDERTLREIHLAPFERVVTDAKPATVMCSYNRINGVYSSENRWLLTDVLRDEWGFEGLVISDWGAVLDRVAALQAGLDLAMPGPGERSTKTLVSALSEGRIDERVVTTAAGRVAEVADRYVSVDATPFDRAAHHHLARELAAECAVLLKNDGDVLPLTQTSIVVVGEFAERPRYQGEGSSRVNATLVDVPLESIRSHASERGATVRFEPGFDSTDDSNAADLRRAAVDAARDSDVVVVFAGTPESEESEGFDRSRLDLPDNQVTLIRAVAAVARKTVVVLSNGGVVALEPWHDDVDAILEGFLLGQGAGQALADLLFGVANPSGRLAETIPLRLQDTPSYLTFPGEQEHVRYGEGVMVGYRHYVTADAPVRYPFGHGLSYTHFDVSSLQVECNGPDAAVATVRVTNTGARPGKHVVQVYVATDAGPVRRPTRTLGAFTKIELGSGESRDVRLELDRRAFAYWDIVRHSWVVPPGIYSLQVCADAATIQLTQEVELAGDALPPTLSLQSPVGEWLAHPRASKALTPLLTGLMAQAAARDDESAAVAAAVADTDGLPEVVRLMPMIQLVGVSGGAIDPTRLMDLVVDEPTRT